MHTSHPPDHNSSKARLCSCELPFLFRISEFLAVLEAVSVEKRLLDPHFRMERFLLLPLRMDSFHAMGAARNATV